MLFIVAIWLIAFPISKQLPGDTFKDPVNSAYSGLNVLFTALAFGGVIATLLFQAEQSKFARREAIERSIFELFQTFTSKEFQHIKNCSYRVLLASVKNREYAEYVASRLFVVDQRTFPSTAEKVLRSLDGCKQTLPPDQIQHADTQDRIMLDNMLNFFALLAQRESSGNVIKHCDFAYDWWRPMLWIIADLQDIHHEQSKIIQKYCKNRLIKETLGNLDAIYGHSALLERDAIWKYISEHPKIKAYGLDPAFLEFAPGHSE